MERGSPAGQGDGMADADPLGELAFEGVDVGSGRSDPVRVECLQQHPPLLVTHLRRRQVDAVHLRASWSG